MVNISKETEAEVSARLERVIQQSRLKLYSETYIFEEFPLSEFKVRANDKALALVRDDHVWSQLVVAADTTSEQFTIWRFHFPSGVDNSGFVGWLATHLKTLFGTGVFVVCGQNSNDGGIFDYWGCPLELGDQIITELKRLSAGHNRS